MLRILLPVVFLLLGLGGGIGAGIVLGGGDEPSTEEGDHAAAEGQEMDDHADDDHTEDGHDGGGSDDDAVMAGSSEDLEYVRLSNQFVVPIVREATVRSLVVMSLTVEVRSGENTEVLLLEPRLRDAFLRVMFSHANAGGFDGSFTSPSSLNPLRSGLRDAARDILGPTVNDVLIVDIVRQDA